jgi:acyl-CoA synthetase (NDP forming)
MTETEKNAKIIIEAGKKWKNKPIITSFLGGAITASSVRLLEENRVPNYGDLKDAALAMKSLIKK